MFKHLLVPLDGSSLAESVMPTVAYLARTLGASVTLFHVVEKDARASVHGERHLTDSAAATVYLAEMSQKYLPASLHIDYHVHEAPVTDVARSIVDHKNEFHHDLVVLCTHGRGQALHLLFGSIAQQVIHHGDVPVLILHPVPPGSAAMESLHSMLVPLDEMGEHQPILPVAQSLAAACGANLHLVMVIQTWGTVSGRWTAITRFFPGTTARLLEESVEEAEHELAAMAGQLAKRGLKVSATVLRGDPAGAIVEAAEKMDVDLIVLGTHGRTGMEALLSSSVANKVNSLTLHPLLLIPVPRIETIRSH